MNNCSMKQMEEKHLPNQVDLMIWSDKLDLLALSNMKGEVQVHRLHWQKVWNFPPKEHIKVNVMTWRPDGKALAIGYSSGSVFIVDIEDKEVLDKYELDHEISGNSEEVKQLGVTCMTWSVRTDILENSKEYNLYNDADIFLQKPPLLNTSFNNQNSEENTHDFKEVQNQTQLSILLVGYGTGYISFSVFGRYSFGTIHLSQIAKDECGEYKVLNMNFSNDYSTLQVIYKDITSNYLCAALINTSVISEFAEEILMVATTHGKIVQLLSYLDQTMISITEAWEHILLEMDTKMAYYAASVPEGGVSADLLELLMLGVPSDELEIFLLQELTAKGLKKFGNSVELSYSTIQKLVLKQLNIVSQNLTYYLSELRGLPKIKDRYKIFEIEENMMTEAIKACCGFLNKCLELQLVIDVSMRNYKAFFRWLFVVIVRLLDEQTPSEIVKITQQELTHIAEFLYNFDSVQEENRSNQSEKVVKFNLERLGQYLLDQDLNILPEDDDNPWRSFLQDNPCLIKESDTIFDMSGFRKFSLVQQQKHLKHAITKLFDVSDKDVGKHFTILYNLKCYKNKVESSDENLKISQIYDSMTSQFMAAFLDTENQDMFCFMSVNVSEKICASQLKSCISSGIIQATSNRPNGFNMEILDLQFYSSEQLSLLVRHPYITEHSIFIQMPVKVLLANSQQFNTKTKSCLFTDNVINKDLCPFLEPEMYKVLEKMDGFKVAVSGGRKVSVVLSKSRRKVRVFEMEVYGDDEEESLDVTPHSNITHRSDNSGEISVSSVKSTH